MSSFKHRMCVCVEGVWEMCGGCVLVWRVCVEGVCGMCACVEGVCEGCGGGCV